MGKLALRPTLTFLAKSITVSVLCVFIYVSLAECSAYLAFTPSYHARSWASLLSGPSADLWLPVLVSHALDWYLLSVLPAFSALVTGGILLPVRSIEFRHRAVGAAGFSALFLSIWGIDTVQSWAGVVLFLAGLLAYEAIRLWRRLSHVAT